MQFLEGLHRDSRIQYMSGIERSRKMRAAKYAAMEGPLFINATLST